MPSRNSSEDHRPPSVSGVLETALYVEDVGRSRDFYRELFGFEILMEDRRICALNVSDEQVLLLCNRGASVDPIPMPGGTIPPHDGSGQLHLAFRVSDAELDRWKHWLHDNEITVESEVEWGRGGRSVYFRDPDDHLVELVGPGVWRIY